MPSMRPGQVQWIFEKLCQEKDVDQLKKLIQSGWNVNSKFPISRWGSEGALPLQLIVRDEWLDGTITLLKAGAQTWQTFEEHYGERWSRTCLMYACRRNNFLLVQALVEYGKPPDINLRDRYQHSSPLLEAIYSSRNTTQIVEYLLSKGAETDIIAYKDGFRFAENSLSPITVCLQDSNYSNLKLLINYGATLHFTPQEYIMQQACHTKYIYNIPYTSSEYRKNKQDYGKKLIEFGLANGENTDGLWRCIMMLIQAGCCHAGLPISKLAFVSTNVFTHYDPMSLKWLCRRFLRIQLGLFKPPYIKRLPLPNMLQNYILCMDL